MENGPLRALPPLRLRVAVVDSGPALEIAPDGPQKAPGHWRGEPFQCPGAVVPFLGGCARIPYAAETACFRGVPPLRDRGGMSDDDESGRSRRASAGRRAGVSAGTPVHEERDARKVRPCQGVAWAERRAGRLGHEAVRIEVGTGTEPNGTGSIDAAWRPVDQWVGLASVGESRPAYPAGRQASVPSCREGPAFPEEAPAGVEYFRPGGRRGG
jgi:hypothetical protein